jgi:uncharacterized protein DUF3306
MSGGDEHFFARWSRRKREGKQAPPEAPPPAPPTDATRAAAPDTAAAAETPLAEPSGTPQPQPLPPLESLTPESDFTPFMQAEVDPGVRRQALKTLFQDPHFNVMDGLDVYIDDYSKPDPLPEGWLAKMNQVARLGAYVEPDVEAEAQAAQPPAGAAEAPVGEVAPGPIAATSGEVPAEDAAPPGAAEEMAPEGPGTGDSPRKTPDHS